MVWKTGSDVVEVRRSFIDAYQVGDCTLERLCAIYEVSRSTGYSLVSKWKAEGDAAFLDKPRTPHHSPNRFPSVVAERVLCARHQYGWGPKKLKVILDQAFEEAAPSATSIGNILRRCGLGRKWTRRVRTHPTNNLREAKQPNDVWAVDHKGKMKNLGLEPLNVIDLHSRFWLCCEPFIDKTYLSTRNRFEQLFDKVGLPKIIRVDGGNPWASHGPHRLTRLSAWWRSLGIEMEVVGSCQENGAIERLHGTIARGMDEPGIRDVRKHFDEQMVLYNEHRPHEALHMDVPASRYRPSTTSLLLKTADYNDCDEERLVHPNGTISYLGKSVVISESLVGHKVGLRRLTKAKWLVRFYNLDFGLVDFENQAFNPAPAKAETSPICP